MEQLDQYLNLGREWLLTYGPNLLVALIILIAGRLVVKWVTRLTRKALRRSGMDDTLILFLDKLIYYTLLVAVVLAAADQLGIKTTSFLAILGAAGLAVGLALKDSLSNFASGVMLILFQPFRVGDVVSTAGVTGKISSISIFNTVLNTADNQKIIVPNSAITSDVITNITANPTRRLDLVIGIGYDDDIRTAKDILEGIIRDDKRILDDPAPTIALGELGASSVDLLVRPWVRTEEYWDVRADLLERIKITFDQKGITFPYPQQDVHMYSHTSG